MRSVSYAFWYIYCSTVSIAVHQLESISSAMHMPYFMLEVEDEEALQKPFLKAAQQQHCRGEREKRSDERGT